MATRIEVNRIADLPHHLREEVRRASLSTFTDGTEWLIEGDWQITAYEDDQWVSVQQIFERTVYVNRRPVPVAGLGNMMTRPEWRDNGYGTRVFVRTLAFLGIRLPFEYAMMFCERDQAAQFERFDWCIVDVPVTYLQSSGPRQFNGNFYTLVYSVNGSPWPQGSVDLRSLPW